jgi:hypothetical protein
MDSGLRRKIYDIKRHNQQQSGQQNLGTALDDECAKNQKIDYFNNGVHWFISISRMLSKGALFNSNSLNKQPEKTKTASPKSGNAVLFLFFVIFR